MADSDPMGLAGAYGAAGGANALQQLLARRFAQQQYADLQKQRDFQNQLELRKLEQADELKRLQLQQGADQKDQTAFDTLITQGAFKPGQQVSPQTVGRAQRVGVGDLFPEQQSLPSQQTTGFIRMGPTGPAGGQLSTTSSAPQGTGRFIFAGTGKQADTTSERERKIAADKDKADNAAALADVRERLATVAENKPQTQPGGFQLVPETDPKTGAQTGRFFSYNTKTNSWSTVAGAGPGATKVPPGAAQNAQHEQSKKDALGSLDQLDQAIEQARALIGPGAGRVSNIQQMIGNPDPKVQALGTKMLLAKMQVDHAATGTVRAGASPQLLARWDNLLGNVQNAESLKASVQAMREILGGGASGNVAMIAPDGRRLSVPPDKVAELEQHGAKRAQ